jgi:hypothetical protein
MSNGVPRHGLQIVVPLELSEWLMLSQKAVQNNKSIEIPPLTTLTGVLHPDSNLPYVLLDAIQFDGVQSGQISFEFISGRQRVAGYAVQAFIQAEVLLSDKGQGIRYSIVSQQTSTAVLNIDYLSVQSNVIDNEVRPALDYLRIGAR